MFQRLLLLLLVLSVSGAAFSQDVMTPADGDYVYDPNAALGSLTNPIPAPAGTVQKWVRDPSQKNRIGSWQSVFKSYRLGTMSYRVRFPKNYNPANKYPMVIFLHGAGEACDVNNSRNAGGADRENQDQLFWGAQEFSSRIDNNEWNGFLLFPQLYSNSAEWADLNSLNPTNAILDKLVQYNGVDPDRIIVMGLSAGGLGSLFYASSFPTRIATVVTSAPEQVANMVSSIPSFVHIPVWIGAGGLDGGSNGCDPYSMFYFQDSYINSGGNVYMTYSVNEGHVMWNTQWYQRDINNKYILSAYWNNAHKAQPLLYFQNSQFCAGQPISARMGISAGLGTYEWQADFGGGYVVVGSNSNEFTATLPGTYRVHFKRTGSPTFSDWTPNPVVISTKQCTTDTAFAENFDFHRDWTSAFVYHPRTYGCQTGIVTTATDGPGNLGSISQDGAGVVGGKFLLNSTTSASGCTYTTSDQVWRNYLYPVTIQQNTLYTLNFSMANQNNYFNGDVSPANAASLSATINNVAVTPAGGVRAKGTGNTSWKRYSYTWNSGSTGNNPELAIVNNTANTSWNDFILDEISLVKYKAPPMPGAAVSNATLWAKANSLKYADNTSVMLWTNNDVNGDNLAQPNSSWLPILKNNASDNINFNPVVNFTASNSQFLQAIEGYSGTASHTAVTAYVVANISNTTQDDKNVLIENQLPEGSPAQVKSVRVTLRNNGKLSWTAGVDPDYVDFSNTVVTPDNAVEANKPIVWTLSKDNNNTANGNKQDIRKNGIVIATGNNTSTFKGNGSPFGMSNGGQFFDGKVAEVIYLLDNTVTPAIQNKIESYLGLKYGTSMGSAANSFNYTASDGTTVFWPNSTTFQNDVFGIGTDSASGLVQAKSNSANSGSGDGTGQFAKGNLVLSTNATLRDKRFLMIGNDAGSLSQVVIAQGAAPTIAVGSTRVNRNWKVVNTGGVTTVDLSFDTTGLANLTGGPVFTQYALMIDNDGDNLLYNTSVSFFTATGVSGKKLVFSGVTLPNNAFFTIITNKLSAALPAVWLGFTAEAVNGNALLNWKTSDEINVDHYVVEHSYNGISFSSIGTVTANNNSGVNNYTYTDNGLAAGVHYYRIRRVDKDGKSDYTDIKSVKITTSGANVQIRPNPVAGSTLELAISVQQSMKTSVQVMSAEGKLMLKQDIKLAAGSNFINMNIEFIPSGIYLLQVQLNDGVVTRKFIRQH